MNEIGLREVRRVTFDTKATLTGLTQALLSIPDAIPGGAEIVEITQYLACPEEAHENLDHENDPEPYIVVTLEYEPEEA